MPWVFVVLVSQFPLGNVFMALKRHQRQGLFHPFKGNVFNNRLANWLPAAVIMRFCDQPHKAACHDRGGAPVCWRMAQSVAAFWLCQDLSSNLHMLRRVATQSVPSIVLLMRSMSNC